MNIMDESGADSLPLEIAGSIALLAIVLGLISYGLSAAMPAVNTAAADHEMLLLSGACSSLLVSGPRDLTDQGAFPSAIKTVDVVLPPGTEYVSMGEDPGSSSSHEGTVYYGVHGNKKAIVVNPHVKIRARDWYPDPSSHGHSTIYGSGKYRITIEAAYDPVTGERYLLTCFTGC